MTTPTFRAALAAIHLFAVSAGAAVVDATYNSPTDVPVTAAGYTATGNVVNFTLNFAPATGAYLTVVKNTGLAFISGRFSNLAQGQPVTLTYAGMTYNFVANYYGGSGNDLILQWAICKAFAWGLNDSGQLGNNSSTNTNLPFAVTSSGILSGKIVTAVAAGSSHSLALCSDGSVAAWGANDWGQLGNNSTSDCHTPVDITSSGTLSGKV